MFHLTIPEFVVICVGGAFIGSLILFPSWRKQVGSLLSGFLELFMQDVSKTPEGARANYAQSISEEQEKLGKVNDALISLAGQLQKNTKQRQKQLCLKMTWKVQEHLVS